MVAFPAPLDSLIGYVRALHPEGGPLERLSDAVVTAEELSDQADALIGHFVDQARVSGASWSQIGAAMGVTKQAAQQRFTPSESPLPEGKEFSRFTARARAAVAAAGELARTGKGANSLAAAGAGAERGTPAAGAGAESGTPAASAGAERGTAAAGAGAERGTPAAGAGAERGTAAVEHDGASAVDTSHLAAGAVVDPAGLAGKAIQRLGVSNAEVFEALGVGVPAIGADPDPTALRGLQYTDACRAAFKQALRTALRLGHNYIGTEHLLLGVIADDSPVRKAFSGLGLQPDLIESAVSVEIAETMFQRRRQAGGSSVSGT